MRSSGPLALVLRATFGDESGDLLGTWRWRLQPWRALRGWFTRSASSRRLRRPSAAPRLRRASWVPAGPRLRTARRTSRTSAGEEDQEGLAARRAGLRVLRRGGRGDRSAALVASQARVRRRGAGGELRAGHDGTRTDQRHVPASRRLLPQGRGARHGSFARSQRESGSDDRVRRAPASRPAGARVHPGAGGAPGRGELRWRELRLSSIRQPRQPHRTSTTAAKFGPSLLAVWRANCGAGLRHGVFTFLALQGPPRFGMLAACRDRRDALPALQVDHHRP